MIKEGFRLLLKRMKGEEKGINSPVCFIGKLEQSPYSWIPTGDKNRGRDLNNSVIMVRWHVGHSFLEMEIQFREPACLTHYYKKNSQYQMLCSIFIMEADLKYKDLHFLPQLVYYLPSVQSRS